MYPYDNFSFNRRVLCCVKSVKSCQPRQLDRYIAFLTSNLGHDTKSGMKSMLQLRCIWKKKKEECKLHFLDVGYKFSFSICFHSKLSRLTNQVFIISDNTLVTWFYWQYTVMLVLITQLCECCMVLQKPSNSLEVHFASNC